MLFCRRLAAAADVSERRFIGSTPPATAFRRLPPQDLRHSAGLIRLDPDHVIIERGSSARMMSNFCRATLGNAPDIARIILNVLIPTIYSNLVIMRVYGGPARLRIPLTGWGLRRGHYTKFHKGKMISHNSRFRRRNSGPN